MTNRRILLTVKISMTSYVRQTISLHAAFPPPTVKYYVRASIAHSTVQLPIAKKTIKTISLHAAFPPPAVKYYVRASIVRSTVQLLIAKIKCERDASTRTHE